MLAIAMMVLIVALNAHLSPVVFHRQADPRQRPNPACCSSTLVRSQIPWLVNTLLQHHALISMTSDWSLNMLAVPLLCQSIAVPSDALCYDPQASRPKMKRWIDSFGEVYSKLIIAATLGIMVVLPMLGVPMLGTATRRGAFYRAMGFLTAASPCALVLVPLAYVSAIGAVTSRSASRLCNSAFQLASADLVF